MNPAQIVPHAKQRFDAELHTPAYHQIHADAEHLEKLVQLMNLHAGKRYLDLGTGNGYLAFEFAKRLTDIAVTGLDIADNAMARNVQLAHAQGLRNLAFTTYQGTTLPFRSETFAGIISRYALHHFPTIAVSVQEIFRVLEPGGYVVIADPITLEDDTEGFIDRFQLLKQDGHVHFYRAAELISIFREQGFHAEQQFWSAVRYPRDMGDEYTRLFAQTSAEILNRYAVEFVGSQVFITVQVLNIRFRNVV